MTPLEPTPEATTNVPEGQPSVRADQEEDALRLFDAVSAPAAVAGLRDRYLVPPFTVLDRKAGQWQTRVRQWKKLGMEGEIGVQSEDGRDAGARAYNTDKTVNVPDPLYEGRPTVSIFDPFLCEIAYAWFCPPGGAVLDPFAGGSVRGVIAGAMGLTYKGIDLSAAQVEANRDQAANIFRHSTSDEVVPLWAVGDARAVLARAADPSAQMIFTCPPYGNLEVYSDDPADLSTMDPAAFDDAYRDILAGAVNVLVDDAFAVIVVGNYRGADGTLRDLSGITVRAMQDAGASYYNEAVILDPPGTAAWRAPRQFDASRKLVRVHQHLLSFVKGNPKRATARIREATP